MRDGSQGTDTVLDHTLHNQSTLAARNLPPSSQRRSLDGVEPKRKR